MENWRFISSSMQIINISLPGRRLLFENRKRFWLGCNIEKYNYIKLLQTIWNPT
jgi:hypothetical protein